MYLELLSRWDYQSHLYVCVLVCIYVFFMLIKLEKPLLKVPPTTLVGDSEFAYLQFSIQICFLVTVT